MKLEYIEHIGIAVNSIEEAKKYYEEVLQLKCYAIEEIPDQKVKTAFFKVGQTKIELLEPTADDSPIAKFLKKRGPGMHHIAFKVDDTNKALKNAKDKGIKLIDESSRKGAEGLQIGFLHPKTTYGVLTEFCNK